jgi:HEAT repeat protein
VLAAAVAESKGLDDSGESEMRLERLADLCAQVPGPIAVDALVEILDEESARVRVAAGEALLDVAFERYAEVARAVERALDEKREGIVMSELPHVLAEVDEPGSVALLRRFLELADADAVASAIEGLVMLSDPSVIPDLEKLADDGREVVLEGVEDELAATIGELASEAIDALGNLPADA